MRGSQNRGAGWTAGKACEAGASARGWFLGPYVQDDDRRASAVQVKWGVSAAGDRREGWASADSTTSLCVLVSGEFVLRFKDDIVVLKEPGDFALWTGVPHSWFAVTDCATVTVRWVEPDDGGRPANPNPAPGGPSAVHQPHPARWTADARGVGGGSRDMISDQRGT